MSWTDIFPVFNELQITEYEVGVTVEEAELLEGLFGVAKCINPRVGKHLVATTLFWKKMVVEEGQLPPVTRERMINARKLGLMSQYEPWSHYVVPLIEGAVKLKEARPDIVFRVYLAADLEFLVPDLVGAGCEVMLMKSSSIVHNPGAMWRFLALEEKDRWVTITDSDIARDILPSVERTELVVKSGLGLWRVPYVFGSDEADDHPGYYRPINACQFGGMGGYLRMVDLMKAFIWHALRETMPNQCVVPGAEGKPKELPIYGTNWPAYGFDEWFLSAAVYPRLAFEGMLTFFLINPKVSNHWFALDSEYVTWANPKSEILFFGEWDVEKRKKTSKKILNNHSKKPWKKKR